MNFSTNLLTNLLTYNLSTISSFRIGIPSILFYPKLTIKFSTKLFTKLSTQLSNKVSTKLSNKVSTKLSFILTTKLFTQKLTSKLCTKYVVHEIIPAQVTFYSTKISIMTRLIYYWLQSPMIKAGPTQWLKLRYLLPTLTKINKKLRSDLRKMQ